MSKLTEPAAWLLTWNPDSDWAVRWEAIAEYLVGNWSARVNFRNMKEGDDLWFLRQGEEPRGIFAHAVAMGAPYPEETTWFVGYWMDWIVNPSSNPEKMIRRDVLINDPLFSRMHWDAQCSGPRIPPEINHALRERVFGK